MARARYEWNNPVLKSQASASRVGKELAALELQLGDDFNPRAVIDFARKRGSELHKLFEWNDGRAAQKFREKQARTVIQSIRVVVMKSGKAEQKRVYVNVRQATADKSGGSYKRIEKLTEAEVDVVRMDAEQDLRQWLGRYEELKARVPTAFRSVTSAVAELRKPAKKRSGKSKAA
jgi:hypothetical protein